jgi:formylmethanofuran dehydrogenase subunit D
MRAKLITGRTAKQGASLEIGKTSDEYLESVAVIMMNEDDLRKIGVREGAAVEVSTEFGSTVVRCRKSSVDPGIAFMPYGPWANMVIGVETHSSGTPDFKSLEVEILPTDKQVPTVHEIVRTIRVSQ